MASKPSGRGGNANNWPVLVALGAVFLLVATVLPNPFRIPSNDPSTVAEYAPVPGKKENAPDQGGFSATGFAEGSAFGTEQEPTPPPPRITPPPREVAVYKPCKGSGRRQTEDPHSPPCAYEPPDCPGDSPLQGVTEDEIKVVFYNDLGVGSGRPKDLNEPYSPADESANQDYDHRNLVKTMKAHLRYFQEHYQTYCRTVHAVAYASSGALDGNRLSDARTFVNEQKPFAVVYLGDNAGPLWDALAKQHQVAGFGLNFDVPQASYERNKPYMWSFVPDQETENAYSAAFICRKLVGRKAKYAKGLAATGGNLASRDRKFAIVAGRSTASNRAQGEMADKLKAEIQRQCGLDVKVFSYNAESTSGGAEGASDIVPVLKSDNYTTVICYCVAITDAPAFQNAAQSAQYFPEWYWDHASSMDRPVWLKTQANQAMSNFGVTYFWRQTAFTDQHHYRAYLKEEPGSVPNVRWSFNIYHLFLNLFSGIQGAGPELGVDWAEKGMFTFKQRSFDDQFVATGGYGPGGPSLYTFIDTAMGWWWDPTGTPPGGKANEGCQRVMRQGFRYTGPGGQRPWPEDDDDLFTDEATAPRELKGPCHEDTRKIEDPQTSGGI